MQETIPSKIDFQGHPVKVRMGKTKGFGSSNDLVGLRFLNVGNLQQNLHQMKMRSPGLLVPLDQGTQVNKGRKGISLVKKSCFAF